MVEVTYEGCNPETHTCCETKVKKGGKTIVIEAVCIPKDHICCANGTIGPKDTCSCCSACVLNVAGDACTGYTDTVACDNEEGENE